MLRMDDPCLPLPRVLWNAPRAKRFPMCPYQKQIDKYVMVPANARVRRVTLEERLKQLAAFFRANPT